jgi:murein DD-endopeptidase MepM/ murein hydrolase activator NlpD
MGKIFNSIDRFILKVGESIASYPRLSALTIFLFLTITISGWILAVHYHRMSELLSIPPESNQIKQTTSSNILQNSISNTGDLTAADLSWQIVTVKHGENLQSIFKKLHLFQKELAEILALGEDVKPLTKLKPGEQIQFLISNKHELREILFPIDAENNLKIEKIATGFTISKNQISTSATLANSLSQHFPTAYIVSIPQFGDAKFGSAIVKKSVYAAGISAGLSRKQMLFLIHIYTADNNIIKKIRSGDRVSVIYLPKSNNSTNDILAAELTIKNKPYQIFRFTDPNGKTDYYTADGINFHPPILRAPITYTHISSYFSVHRWQPILHFFRPHFGVDYAAPMGTPIKAGGDGHIMFVGEKEGYGKTIEIKHIYPYETLYAHLSHFAKNIKNGSAVKQGEIIGYVGSTGLSTGAHLHYEIRINNIPHNPLLVTLPIGSHINQAYKEKFLVMKKELLAVMNMDQNATVAANQTNPK